MSLHEIGHGRNDRLESGPARPDRYAPLEAFYITLYYHYGPILEGVIEEGPRYLG